MAIVVIICLVVMALINLVGMLIIGLLAAVAIIKTWEEME